ncbi:MAG: prephenate [Actinobacteria bacterium]|nr:MAG: prephenate [Actinomycetota bacterium]MDO8949714.1 prephenate dehydrogenase/arogenate dehydrogenase family protein [Actinomycetota bacterium]
MFKSVMIVGLGLIGGSIAAAAKELDDAPVIYAVDTDQVTLAYAVETGLADAAAQPDQAFRSGWLDAGTVELVVLATPAGLVAEWIGRLADAGYRGIVTDVASTKAGVLAAARHHHSQGLLFIGGHPMAGSERSGVKAADPKLFRGAYYVLAPTDDVDLEAYRQLHEFVSALGARVISVPAEAHDEAVAVISHVPHVAAAALVALASRRSESSGRDVLRLAAGGFKDMTRIAAGSPDLWTGICLDNAEPVVAGIEELQEVLGEFADSVREGDAVAVRDWLAIAAEVRTALPAQWVPDTAALFELSLPMSDRPGVVGEITTAVSRAGCNIEDIEIDHQSEDSAVLRLILTDEGNRRALLADLSEAGFAAVLRPLE